MLADRQAYLAHALAVGAGEKYEPVDIDSAICDWLIALAADPADSAKARVRSRVAELLGEAA